MCADIAAKLLQSDMDFSKNNRNIFVPSDR